LKKKTRLEGTYCADPDLAPQLIRIACEKEKLYLYYTNGERIELFQKNLSAFYTDNGITYTFKLNEYEQPISVYVDDPAFPYTAKYNDGPNDGVGPDLKVWQKYLGFYKFEDEGRPNYLGVTIKSGFLYLIFKDNLKLFHYQNNLYFTADGEAVLFGNGELNYKGITATKVAFDVKQFIDTVSNNEIKIDYYSNAISSLIPIIYALKGFKSAIVFIEKIVKIDNEFKENFTFFGKLLISQGQLDEATNCFNKSLENDSENKVAEKYLLLIQQIKGE
ncbi:MAG: tetratricopeptide repeat protein, partial [Candidatus Thorarchaeota archaeon]